MEFTAFVLFCKCSTCPPSFFLSRRAGLPPYTYQPGDDCNWAWLKLNGAELMSIPLENRTTVLPLPIPPVVAHDHYFLFFGCKDLDAAYQHLLAHGVNLKPPKVAPYGIKQLYFHDPDSSASAYSGR